MLENIPVEKILKIASNNGNNFAEIFAEHTTTTTIVHDNKKIEQASQGTDAGFGLRVISDKKTAYGFTNDPSELLNLARSIAGCENETDNGQRREHGKPETKDSKQVIKSRPDATQITDKVKLIERAVETAWGQDSCIKQVQVSWKDTTRKICVANSKNKYIEDEKIDTIFTVHVTAQKNGHVQTGHEVSGGFVGLEFFLDRTPENIAKTAAGRAVSLLDAKPAPRGMMPVIISSEAGGTIIHEAVGHGLEADLAEQGLSVYKNKLGAQVASELITVVDDATISYRRGTFSFDDEGTPSQRTVLIENGILKSYMHNYLTSLHGTAGSTGNGRRESYRHRPTVRMTNTVITPGKDNPTAILSSVENGLLVKKMGGGQVNTINGDFVFDVQEAYIIERGRVGDLVRGATLIGNGPKILMEIDMVGTDLGFGLGTCGKEGQGVPVGHGIPTLRIPLITVGGTK